MDKYVWEKKEYACENCCSLPSVQGWCLRKAGHVVGDDGGDLDGTSG